MKRSKRYQPEQKYTETFLVVDVDRDAAAVGAFFRAYMTAQGDEDSPFVESATSELPEHVLEWCEMCVVVDREAHLAIAPDVLAHDGPLADGYTGGGIAIAVLETPPSDVLDVLKGRAMACAKKIRDEAPRHMRERRGLQVLGLRLVSRVVTDTSVEV